MVEDKDIDTGQTKKVNSLEGIPIIDISDLNIILLNSGTIEYNAFLYSRFNDIGLTLCLFVCFFLYK